MEKYIRKNKNRMIDYDFQPEEYVLVLNKSKPIKNEGKKDHTGYMGLWIVVYCLHSGAYQLAELNGAVSCLKFDVFCFILYYLHNHKIIPIMQIINAGDLENLSEEDNKGIINGKNG